MSSCPEARERRQSSGASRSARVHSHLGGPGCSSDESFTEDAERLPICGEFDRLSSFFYDDGVDRSEWYDRVLNESPELRDFIERVDPVARAATLARLYLPKVRFINQVTLLALISQHLRTLGMMKSQNCLHEEWPEPLDIPAQRDTSALNTLIQRGISRAERFWELSLPSPGLPKDIATCIDEELSRTIGGATQVADDETPLCDESIGDPALLRFDEETWQPMEASLNQIVWLMTGGHQGANDALQMMDDNTRVRMVDSVCLMYRSFTTPRVFFTKIKQRFEYAMKEEQGERKKVSMEATCDLLRKWLTEVGDYLEPEIQVDVKVFIESELPSEWHSRIGNVFAKKSDEGIHLYDRAPPVALSSALLKRLWSGKFELLDVPPEEVARQFTVFSSSRYYAIKKTELLDNAWRDPRLKHRAPNICELYDHQDRVRAWVQAIILREESDTRREEIFRFLFKVMEELEKMQNYLDLLSFFSGFEAPAVWNHLKELGAEKVECRNSTSGRDFLKQVGEYAQADSNYTKWRDKQRQILLQNPRRPCLPYLIVSLQDIFNIFSEVQDKIGGLINLRKCYRMRDLVEKVMVFQTPRYAYLPIEQILDKIAALTGFDDDAADEAYRLLIGEQ